MTLSPEQQAEVDALFAEMDELKKDAVKLDEVREEKVIKKRKLDDNEKLFPPPTPKEIGKIRVKYVTDPGEMIDHPFPDEGNPQTIGSVFMVVDPSKIDDPEALLKQGNILVNQVDSNITMFEVHPNDPKPLKKRDDK